jgi:hypothetical protein
MAASSVARDGPAKRPRDEAEADGPPAQRLVRAPASARVPFALELLTDEVHVEQLRKVVLDLVFGAEPYVFDKCACAQGPLPAC